MSTVGLFRIKDHDLQAGALPAVATSADFLEGTDGIEVVYSTSGDQPQVFFESFTLRRRAAGR